MTPFADLPQGPRQHFRLHALAAAAHLIDQAGKSLGSHEELLDKLPFVAGYLDEIDDLGALPLATDAPFDWEAAIGAWAAGAPDHLPLAALRDAAGLDFAALTLLVAVGMIEEDGRFGDLFAIGQSDDQERPTAGLLHAWWRPLVDDGGARARLRRLRELGLVDVANPTAPRGQWALLVPSVVWDGLRGELAETPAPFLRHTAARSAAAAAEEPILDDSLRETALRLPALLGAGELDAVIVRGPHHNGRRTLLGWIAAAAHRGVLEVALCGKPEIDADRLRVAAPLATLLGAMPLFLLDPGPGEMIELPRLPGAIGPIGVVLGRTGGVTGAGVERAVTLTLDMPELPARARHLGLRLGRPVEEVGELAAQFRMTSGNLRRAAALAGGHATLAGRADVSPADLREASRALGRQALDTLATRLPDGGDWTHFAAAADTLRDLRSLEHRCRQREHLGARVGDALARSLNCGVRALFQGPSGTGKTLAARLLASSLQKDVYRVDLSAIVNKYIGETEKNLARVLAVAEELDIILLFDEGDALMARRTGVGNANDRYANLETNFLLQRLETFEGIALVTTNAAESIDRAFERRMDVIVDFRLPDPAERYQLWQMHLPPAHAVETSLLREAALRCQLSGGQIRNAVLHATLLALDDGGAVQSRHVEAAVAREYRKSGGVCPLRTAAAWARGG